MKEDKRQRLEDENKRFAEIEVYSHDKYIDFVKDLINKHPFSYFSIVKGKNFKTLWKDICEKTSFIDIYFKSNAATRIFYYISKLDELKRCETCGEFIKKDMSPTIIYSHFFCCNRCAQRHESTVAKTKETKLKNHGDENYNNIEKSKATCREKYGVDYSFQADETKEKSKKTLMEHFGVDHQMKSQVVKDKMKAACKEKHGVEHVFQDPDVQAKIKAKNQERLGVDWPMQDKELHKMMHKNSVLTQAKNFFNNTLSKDPLYEALFTVDEWLAHGRKDVNYEYSWRCKKCGKTFKSRIMWGASTYVRCYDCYPVMSDTSSFEKEIADFIKNLGQFQVVNHTQENKQLIPPKEVDIIVKDMQGDILLSIEADGLFWRSAACGKDKNYHLMKTDACLDKGVQLVHVFEDEWTLKKDIAKSRIASLLGSYKKKIYARCCKIMQVSSKEAKMFFDSNHLQGSCASKIAYGLHDGNGYVAMMSFGARRKMMNSKKEEGSWELLRFACKRGIHVIGGASKLLKHFERDFKPKKLLSYADRRWSSGHIYEALGFKLDHIAKPSYWYLDSTFSRRIYRYAFAKHKQKDALKTFDPHLSEQENMLANGYSLIWDCGNYVFEKTY